MGIGSLQQIRALMERARLHLETDVGSAPEGAAPAAEGDVGHER